MRQSKIATLGLLNLIAILCFVSVVSSNQSKGNEKTYAVSFDSAYPEEEVPSYTLAYIGAKNDNITLVCSSLGYDTVGVSWWENGLRIRNTVNEASAYCKSSTLHLSNLNRLDGGRKFTCVEDRRSGSLRTVILKYHVKKDQKIDASLINTSDVTEKSLPVEKAEPDQVDHLEQDQEVNDFSFPSYSDERQIKQTDERFNTEDVKIAVDGQVVHTESIMISFARQQLTCFSLGYNPDSIGWYEGDIRLHTSDTHLEHSSVSSLVLQDLSPKDAGRNFTCRGTQKEGNSQSVTILFSDPEMFRGAVIREEKVFTEGEVLSTWQDTLTCMKQGDNEKNTTIGWYDERNVRLRSEDLRSKYVVRSTLTLEGRHRTRSFTCRIEVSRSEVWHKEVIVRYMMIGPLEITLGILGISLLLFALILFLIKTIVDCCLRKQNRYSRLRGEKRTRQAIPNRKYKASVSSVKILYKGPFSSV